MYFGGTIMTFALPYGAFIAAAVALFYLFRARHSVPRLRWSSSTDQVTSVITREPGPAPEATTVTSAATAIPVAAAPEATTPAPAATTPAGEATAAFPATPAEATGDTDATPANDGPASDSPEGKDGEPG
jgi:hypothetical protein